MIYHYKGRDKNNTRVTGEVEANSALAAKAMLMQKGISPLNLKPKKSFQFFAKKINSKEIALLTRQLASMLWAGIPLMRSLEFLSDNFSKNQRIKTVIEKLKRDIGAGDSLCKAFGKQPIFGGFYLQVMMAAEQTGALDSLLTKLATHLENKHQLRKNIKKALFYPSVVLLMALLVCATLLIFVVPEFERIFTETQVGLPAFTENVIDLSRFLGRYGGWCVVAGMVVFSLLYTGKKYSSVVSKFLDKFFLKVPIFGKLIQQALLFGLTDAFATLQGAGVPLMQTLTLLQETTPNQTYRAAILKIKISVGSGKKLTDALKEAKIFPDTWLQVVSVGDESGTLSSALNKLAILTEAELTSNMQSLSSLLEPLLIALLGIIVGCMVVALYLPIFQLGSVI